MKNSILRLSVLLAFLYSCSGNTSSNSTESGSSPQALMKTYAGAAANSAPGYETCNTYPGSNHRICYRTLLRLTQAFIRKYSEDSTLNGLGGYLDKESLLSAMNADASYNGIVFTTAYYNGTFKNESYLAYQGMKVEDSKEIPCELQKTDYYPVSTSQFIYTETDTTLSAISDFLAQEPEPIEPMTTFQAGNNLETNAGTFLSHFLSAGSAANQRSCFFFGKTELEALLNQEGCVGMRFLWGFEEERSSDKVRILLIGVDDEGNNLLVKPGTSSDEAIYMERGWPPAD